MPWIALVALARLFLGGVEPVRTPTTSARGHGLECAARSCGCPHDEAVADCCCAPRELAESGPSERTVVVAPDAHPERPAPALTSFHCSGGRPGPAALGATPPPALPPAAFALTLERVHAWPARRAHGPRFDLGAEPATPPPRAGTRA